jgi:hypothetical protein
MTSEVIEQGALRCPSIKQKRQGTGLRDNVDDPTASTLPRGLEPLCARIRRSVHELYSTGSPRRRRTFAGFKPYTWWWWLRGRSVARTPTVAWLRQRIRRRRGLPGSGPPGWKRRAGIAWLGPEWSDLVAFTKEEADGSASAAISPSVAVGRSVARP